MQARTLWLLLAAVLLICAIAGVRSCRHDGASDAGVATAATSDGDGTASANDAAAAEAAELRERIRRHDEALYAAVATLQRYLAALGSDDRAKADAFWDGDGPPEDTREADLRSLEQLRGLRIENGKPKALDSQPVPSALEIPVELRAGFEDGPMRRYRGWYRLRRAGDGNWKITSASVDVVPRAE